MLKLLVRRADGTYMKHLRFAALFLSIVLIVALATGYAARRSQLAAEHDQRIEFTAESSAERVAGMLSTVEVVAEIGGTDASADDQAVQLLRDEYRGVTVCARLAARPGDAPVCDSTATMDPDVAEVAQVALLAAPGPVDRGRDTFAHTVVGADLQIFVTVGVDHFAVDATATDVELAVAQSGDTVTSGLTDLDGRRAAVASADGVGSVSIIASSAEGPRLPTDERWLFGVLAVLSLALFVLAAIQYRSEQRRLVERASIDPLTRLPNRSEFERRAELVIAEAQRSDDAFCLLLFDLDGFKEINDTLGHARGDLVLSVLGRRLRDAVRDTDVVARWGGDEFVMLLPGIAEASAARSRATTLAERIIAQPMDDGLTVGSSVGIALYPRHGATLPELVESADSAMYAAKRDGVTHRLAGIESAPIAPTEALTEDRRASSGVG